MFLRKLSLISIAVGALALSACNTYYFDSSIGPDGQQVVTQKAKAKAKTTKKAPVKKNTQNKAQLNKNKALLTPSQNEGLVTVNENNTAALSDVGVVKPFAQDAQGNDLSTNESLNQKAQEVLGTTNNNEQTPAVVAPVVDVNQTPSGDLKPFVENENPQNLNKLEPITNNSEPVVNLDVPGIESIIDEDSPDKCGANSAQKAASIAQKLSLSHAKRLVNEQGPIYVAPTIIPESAQDCVQDVSGVIYQTLSSQGIKAVTGGMSVSQNTGSSALIPALVRACRQKGIRLLNVSIVRHIGHKTVITIRNIRVKDGITLVQNTTQI